MRPVSLKATGAVIAVKSHATKADRVEIARMAVEKSRFEPCS